MASAGNSHEPAAPGLLYMAVLNAQKNRGGPDRRWNAAALQFAIHFEEWIHA